MENGWTIEEKAEHHWRRTFCQIPFVEIYEHADKGKRSLHGLVEFFRRKAHAERAASDELRELLHAHSQSIDAGSHGHYNTTNHHGGLEELEEPGSSIRRALVETRSFVDAMCNHQLLLAKVLEEQVAAPLESLQAASETYIRILRDEITGVNDAYAAAAHAHRVASTRLQKANDDLSDATSRQRNALHGIGVPAFELQRLAARVAKCDDEKHEADVAKAHAKSALYQRIIARDEMAMAVSVAYQRAEEERLDQLHSSLQRFVHVERDRLTVADRLLASLEQHIRDIDRSEDIQLLIHNRRNPDNMHFQGKALALLDWHWSKMEAAQQQQQSEQQTTAHQARPLVPSSQSHYDLHRQHEHQQHVRFARSNSETAIANGSSHSNSTSLETTSKHDKPLPSPHGELARSPMGIALRHYFANDTTGAGNDVALVTALELDADALTLDACVIDNDDDLTVEAPRDDDRLLNQSIATESTTQPDDLAPATRVSFDSDAAVASTSDSPTDAATSSTTASLSPLALSTAVVTRACSTQIGRALFVKCLNRQRSLETQLANRTSFDALVACFHAFLDECVREDDVKAAKTAMILAETFYLKTSDATATDDAINDDNDNEPRSDGDRGATRMYLQEEVKRHAIWKNPSFWEKALLLAIGEELQKTPQLAPWEDLASGVSKLHDAAAATAAIAGLPSREEAVGRVHNIVFGQLGSFTLSMLEFQVPLPQIESFVETMCDAHELTEDQRFLLRKSLHEIFATLHQR